MYLGEAQFRQSQWDEALQEYPAAYEINPDLMASDKRGSAEAGAVCLPPRHFKSQPQPVHRTAMRKGR
jgi:hypothetical protein